MAMDNRGKRLWLRLIQVYGARMAESYGDDIPKPWAEAIEDITEEQIAYGLRNIIKITPIHPPTLGQFVQACVNMPISQLKPVATLQEQIVEYAALHVHDRDGPKGMTLSEYSMPWTYVYREWWDGTRPKGFEKCAECIGIVIEFGDGKRIGWSVAAMQADTEYHQRVLSSFNRPASSQDSKRSRDIKNRAKEIA